MDALDEARRALSLAEGQLATAEDRGINPLGGIAALDRYTDEIAFWTKRVARAKAEVDAAERAAHKEGEG